VRWRRGRLGEGPEVEPSWQVLTEQAVGVLVAAALPWRLVKLLGVVTKAAERDWPGILNAEAAKGWRLVTVDQNIASFERRNG
jgi:hypothetical protein